MECFERSSTCGFQLISSGIHGGGRKGGGPARKVQVKRAPCKKGKIPLLRHGHEERKEAELKKKRIEIPAVLDRTRALAGMILGGAQHKECTIVSR